MDNTAGGKYVM